MNTGKFRTDTQQQTPDVAVLPRFPRHVHTYTAKAVSGVLSRFSKPGRALICQFAFNHRRRANRKIYVGMAKRLKSLMATFLGENRWRRRNTKTHFFFIRFPPQPPSPSHQDVLIFPQKSILTSFFSHFLGSCFPPG